MPLDAGEAAPVGDHAAKLIILEPGDVERADTSRGAPHDPAAVAILADVVFRRHVRQNFVPQEARILVGECIVLDTPHRPLADFARGDEDVDHDWYLLLGREIVENYLAACGAAALHEPLAILPDHQRRRVAGIVLGGDIDPVVALHAVIEPARVDELFREFAVRDARLLVRVRHISRDVGITAELLAIHHVIEGVGPADLEPGAESPGTALAGPLHGTGRLAIDVEGRPAGAIYGEQEVGAIAGDGNSLLDIGFRKLRKVRQRRERWNRNENPDYELEIAHLKRLSQESKAQRPNKRTASERPLPALVSARSGVCGAAPPSPGARNRFSSRPCCFVYRSK